MLSLVGGDETQEIRVWSARPPRPRPPGRTRAGGVLRAADDFGSIR